MYTVWHVNKYKITFKLVIDHWAAARRLRNTALHRASLCEEIAGKLLQIKHKKSGIKPSSANKDTESFI
jgi:hypothetical protein